MNVTPPLPLPPRPGLPPKHTPTSAQFKIIRVAYDPLPPAYSRPFQQLVNGMLRADPDDRPTTGVGRPAAGVWGL